MDAASPSEQAFAMKVAIASKNIEEWLEELSAWSWPTHTTSAGFERPPAKRRRLFETSASDTGLENHEGEQAYETTFLGSLLASDVDRYEERIHEIEQDMEDLNVEDIKSHILHNHIMPLSRPGTPASDSLRASSLSASAYAHMDDFTALVTTSIVQALPNLSKLTRLLNTWSIRLVVLRKSSSFLTALMDAEIALKAGRKAMDPRPDIGHGNAETAREKRTGESILSRSEFDMMKLVVERKIAKAGQYLDFMLDALEGKEDSLPEDWVDRMDSIEREYAEWTAACGQRIRDADWAKLALGTRADGGSTSTGVTEETSHLLVPSHRASLIVEERGTDAIIEPATASGKTESSGDTLNSPDGAKTTALTSGSYGDHVSATKDVGKLRTLNDTGTVTRSPVIMIHPAAENATGIGGSEHEQSSAASASVQERWGAEETSTTELHQLPDSSEDGVPRFDSFDDTGSSADPDVSQPLSDVHLIQTTSNGSNSARAPASVQNSSGQAAHMDSPEAGMWPRTELVNNFHPLANDEDLDIDFPDSGFPEPDLPDLSRERRGSEVSNASTVIHGLQSGFAPFSSDPPDHGTPDYRRFHDVVLPSTENDDVDSIDDVDLPSSPPDFRSSTRSLSVSFNDIPTVVEAPEEEETTPFDASFATEDEAVGQVARHDSPSKMSVASADDQLQQQISEILDSIPARIRLTSEPSAINLNPPDFSMPASRHKVKPDSFPPRSYSSLSNRSSRAGTPSFTLAPAKTSRPRHQRGNQEIKLYHLSRSNGEPPIKLFIRCVGDNGERVMVRVGGGWADLGEYLKEYASHHGRRGGEAKVEVRDLPRISTASRAGSSPPSRPASAMDMSSPVTPLNVRKARRSIGSSAGDDLKAARQPLPKTPLANAAAADDNTPPSSGSSRSRSSSRLSWTEEDSSLGMAGPKSKHIEMSEENKAWVESVKEKVRIASGDQRAALGKSPAAVGRATTPDPKLLPDGKFGELGKVGSTKRVFRRQAGLGTGTGSGLSK